MRWTRSVPALVLLGVLLVQAAWIIAVPPFRGIDEVDHVYRAAAVARGEWVADHGQAPHGRGGLVTVPADLVKAAHGQCAALKYMEHDNCNPERRLPDGSVRVASAASRYNPVLYAYLGTVARPFHGDDAVYAMRIAGALLCALGLAAGAWVLQRGSSGGSSWTQVGFLMALTPVVLYSTVLPAGNGPEMVAALLLWCVLLTLPARPRPGDARVVASGIAAAVVLVTLRSLGPLFAVLIVASVLLVRGWPDLWRLVRNRARAVVIGAVLVALAGAASLAWMIGQTPLSSDAAIRGAAAQVPYLRMLDLIPLNLFQTIDAAPTRSERGPTLVYAIVLIAFVAVTVLVLRSTRGRARRGFVVAVVATQVLPLALSLPTWHVFGPIWQGRYGLPFTAGVAVLGGVLLDRSARPGPQRVTLLVGVTLIGLAQVVAPAYVLHRELASPVSLADEGWWAVPTATVAVIAALGCLLLGWSVWVSRRSTGGPPAETGAPSTEAPLAVALSVEGRERAADGWPQHLSP